MVDSSADFTNLKSLKAEAVGEPGERTFRIVADADAGSAVLWLEKEQLFQLALAVKQLLATVSEESGPFVKLQEGEQSPSERLEFKVGKLVLGHDEASGKFMIEAHGEEDEQESLLKVRVWGDSPQLGAFADEALKVCAAGRPLCPLCGSPMDKAGHRCPRANGHRVSDLEQI